MQLQELGAPEHVVAMAEAKASTSLAVETDFLVFEENWPAVDAFCALGTQWVMQIGAAGVLYQGLNYVAIEPVLRLQQVPPDQWAELFQGLRLMEREVLPLLNERS